MKKNLVLMNSFTTMVNESMVEINTKGYAPDEARSVEMTDGLCELMANISGVEKDAFKMEEGVHKNILNGKYDQLVVWPAFGMRIDPSVKEAVESLTGSRVAIEDNLMLALFDRLISDSGRMILLVPQGILFGTSLIDVKIRRRIIENNWLDSLILLPGGVFTGTGVATVLLVLDKSRTNESTVTMINASEMYSKNGWRNVILDVQQVIDSFNDVTNKISLQSIKDHESCIWIPEVYKISSYSPDEIPEGFKLLNLSKVLKRVRGERHTDVKGCWLTPASVRDFSCMDRIDVSKLDISENIRSTEKIDFPVLVVSNNFDFKAAFVNASREFPIYANSSYFRFYKVDTSIVDVDYLCLKANELEVPIVGSVMKRPLLDEFEKMDILIPDSNGKECVRTQHILFAEARRAYDLQRIKTQGLEDTIKAIKQEFMMNVRSRRHRMADYINNMSCIISDADYYLKVGGDDMVKELTSCVSDLKNDLNSIKSLLEKLLVIRDFDNDDDDIILDEYLSSKEKKNQHYTIRYELSEESRDYKNRLVVHVSKENLETLVDNVISNSIKHGFTNSEETGYEIIIRLMMAKSGKDAVISFIDNGKPLPKNLTKAKYASLGEIAGKTGGTGVGGSDVANIVKKYDGDFDIYSNSIGGTTIEITLPLKF